MARVLARETTVVRTRSRRWLAAGLVAIGVGLGAVAVLVPLVTELIDYRVTETLRNQTIDEEVEVALRVGLGPSIRAEEDPARRLARRLAVRTVGTPESVIRKAL